MVTFYENAGLCCTPSRRRSVFLWLDSSVSKVSNGIRSRLLRHQHLTGNHLPPPPTSSPTSVPATSVRPTYPTVPITLVATSDNRMEPAGHVHPVSVSTSRERRRRRRSRHRDPHRRRSRSRSHHRRPLGRPAHTGSTSDHRTFMPKPPPAVKAMPACRPSGLSYDR